MELAVSLSKPDSVMLKAAMAVTGGLMAIWLTLHMLGNLTVFGGPELMNAYAERLRATGLLWPMRVGLLAACAVHVAAAVLTTRRNWAARPHAYRVRVRRRASTAASRSMRLTGALLLAFIVYHTAQMYGANHLAYVAGDVFHNLVAVLHGPLHVLAYLGATALCCLHLAHGMRSSLQSLGVLPGRRERLVRNVLYAWAWLVTLGFAAGVWGATLSPP